MPPKHKFGIKRNKTQSDTRTQYIHSSTSNKTIVHSTIQASTENDNESSLDPHSISSTTDILTITANDRHYVRVSKQILQNELERQRMKAETLLEQVHLEGDEITLPTSTTSDWRLILQDSITNYDLKQGCISLFEQSNSRKKLTPIEVFHLVHFLKYTTIHIEHREYPHNKLIETIFRKKKNYRKQLTPALIKLICHPSDKLRTAALSFLDAIILKYSQQLFPSITTAGVLPQLFEHLKPHAIPINGTTIDFHRHITSIIDSCLSCSSRVTESRPKIIPSSSRAGTPISEIIDPIIQPFCAYLRHLIASPACPPDYPSGISLLSKLQIYTKNLNYFHDHTSHQELKRFFDELSRNMAEELTSSLDLETTSATLHQLVFGERKVTNELCWVKIFENILVRLSEGRHLSDLGLEALLWFLTNRPFGLTLVCMSDGTFSIEDDGELKFSLELPSKTLGTLITTRPHHATAILDRFYRITSVLDDEALLRHLKD